MKVGERFKPLRETVLDELRQQILDGRLTPGSLLNESALAVEMGVSRLPVREAIRQLESMGLVVSVPRRGVRVAELDTDEHTTAHRIRTTLELLAVSLTVERRDPAVLDALRQMVDVGHAAEQAGDEATLRRLNAEFHDLLSQGSGSPMLHSMLDTVRLQTRHLAGGLQSPHQVSWEEHAAIVDAVIGGRAREATTLMRRHLNDRHAAGIVARSPTAPA